MSCVVVTGATGFIGGHVVKALVAQGNQVTATGRNAAALAKHRKQANCVALNLEADALEELVQDADAVVHCAALSAPWGKEADFHSANVIATQRLLDAVRKTSAARFIHISSPSIYFEFADRLNIPENFCPLQQVNAYARTKWLAEQAVQRASKWGMPTITLRPRAVFGEGDRAIMPRVLGVAKRGTFPLFNDGEAIIDVTYVGNVIEAILLSLQAPSAALGQCFNITNNAPVTVRELLDAMFAALQWKVRYVRVPRWMALQCAGALELYSKLLLQHKEPRFTRYSVGVLGYSQTLNTDAARTALKYHPTITVADGIERYVRSYRSHDAH